MVISDNHNKTETKPYFKLFPVCVPKSAAVADLTVSYDWSNIFISWLFSSYII
jgi:hypothetical protein